MLNNFKNYYLVIYFGLILLSYGSDDFQNGYRTIRCGTVADSADHKLLLLTSADQLRELNHEELAILQYEKFLKITHSGEKGRDYAFYYLGEIYRQSQKNELALSAWKNASINFTDPIIHDLTLFRLGESSENNGEFNTAILYFEAISHRIENIKNISYYHEGHCLSELNKINLAEKYLKLVNPINKKYYLLSLLQLAKNHEKIAQKAEALHAYEEIIHQSDHLELTNLACIKAGILAKDLGKSKQAHLFFQHVLSSADAEIVKKSAILEDIKLANSQGEHELLISEVNTALVSIPEYRKNLLFMRAHAEQSLKNFNLALKDYEEIMRVFPKSLEAEEGKFCRILLLYELHDVHILREIDQYLSQESHPIHRANIEFLKAELLLRSNNYTSALQIYEKINTDLLPINLATECQYKKIFLYIQQSIDSHQILLAINDFIQKHPQDNRTHQLLFQRAKLYRLMNNPIAAYHDDETILSHFPKSLITADIHYGRGERSFQLHHYDEAYTEFSVAKTINSAKFQLLSDTKILLIHFFQKNSLAAIDDAKNISINNIPVEVRFWLADEEFKFNRLEESEKMLLSLIDNFPKNHDLNQKLATVFMAEKKFDASLQYAQLSLSFAHTVTEKFSALILCAEIEQILNHFPEALNDAKSALNLDIEGENNMKIRMIIAHILMQQKKFALAGKEYQRIIILFPNHPSIQQIRSLAASAYQQAGIDDPISK